MPSSLLSVDHDDGLGYFQKSNAAANPFLTYERS
jgi:hypothetical protein